MKEEIKEQMWETTCSMKGRIMDNIANTGESALTNLLKVWELVNGGTSTTALDKVKNNKVQLITT